MVEKINIAKYGKQQNENNQVLNNGQLVTCLD